MNLSRYFKFGVKRGCQFPLKKPPQTPRMMRFFGFLTFSFKLKTQNMLKASTSARILFGFSSILSAVSCTFTNNAIIAWYVTAPSVTNSTESGRILPRWKQSLVDNGLSKRSSRRQGKRKCEKKYFWKSWNGAFTISKASNFDEVDCRSWRFWYLTSSRSTESVKASKFGHLWRIRWRCSTFNQRTRKNLRFVTWNVTKSANTSDSVWKPVKASKFGAQFRISEICYQKTKRNEFDWKQKQPKLYSRKYWICGCLRIGSGLDHSKSKIFHWVTECDW